MVDPTTTLPTMTVAFITGANSGLGRAAAVVLASRGWDVYGTMRDLAKGEKLAAAASAAGTTVHAVVCDITDDASVLRAVTQVTEATGGIDVLVNNAGIGSNGVVEESSIKTYREVMDVNVYGAIRCTQAVLPQMRERRSGAIVNVTSLAGRVALLGQSPYIMSKWALEAISENLAQEVAPFGVRVVIVEPGVFKTAIMAKTTGTPHSTGAYDAAYQRMFAMYRSALASPALTDPAEMGAIIYDAVETDQPRLRWAFGWGSDGLPSGRAAMSDEEWVAMTTPDNNADYVAAFEEHFGLDIADGFDA
jgi:NAD(P)-dependent dehydrogenase (short-subunit alcohol dehydrogenase family)